MREGNTLLHTVIQRPRISHQVASPSPRAWEPCTGLSVSKEGGRHGAVAWIFYRPGLNMADFISEHSSLARTSHKAHLSAEEARKCGPPVLR